MKFEKLSKSAKEKARDWYREGALEYQWWDTTYEDAKAALKCIGIAVDEIGFSGFSSQGDGAHFEGSWYASDCIAGSLKEYAPTDKKLHRIAEVFERIALCRPSASFTVKHSGYYAHAFSTDFTVDIGETNFDKLVDPCNPDFLAKIHAELERELIEAARDAMNWIYRQLEAEYDYLTSDEAIDENIIANEYKFDRDGEFLR